MMKFDSRIFIAGHKGMVGSAIMRMLKNSGYTNLIVRNRTELDLLDQEKVNQFLRNERIEYVFFAAAKVGGILANNTYRAEFIYENLQIQNNIIHFSYLNEVKKMLFLGSSCIYPKNAPQPLKEEYMLTSGLEYTNEPYAVAKIAGIKMCESYNLQYGTNFISAMPTNLFGYNDNFNLETSHVLPALIRKISLAKFLEDRNFELIRKDLDKNPVTGYHHADSNNDIIKILAANGIEEQNKKVYLKLWGSGKPMREFLFADDLAHACLYLMNNVDFTHLVDRLQKSNQNKTHEIRNTHINIGTGKDISISDLAKIISDNAGYGGQIIWDTDKPDGTPRKYLDVSKIASLGWQYQTSLIDGIDKVYSNYIASL